MLTDPLNLPSTKLTGAAALREARKGGQPYGHVFVKATTGAAAIRDHLNEEMEKHDNRKSDGRCPRCGT